MRLEPAIHPSSPASAASTASPLCSQSQFCTTWSPDQAELGRPYKPACPSLNKDTTTRSHRDNFSGSNLSFKSSQRSHRDYFSGSASWALNKNWHMTDPLREASYVASITVGESPDPVQTPPRAALPDVTLDMGAEPPAGRCNLPHSTCGPPSNIPGNTQQLSRAIWTLPVPGYTR